MSSNICSGGRLATAWVIASGASSGATGGPYGLTSGRDKPSIPKEKDQSSLDEDMVVPGSKQRKMNARFSSLYKSIIICRKKISYPHQQHIYLTIRLVDQRGILRLLYLLLLLLYIRPISCNKPSI